MPKARTICGNPWHSTPLLADFGYVFSQVCTVQAEQLPLYRGQENMMNPCDVIIEVA